MPLIAHGGPEALITCSGWRLQLRYTPRGHFRVVG